MSPQSISQTSDNQPLQSVGPTPDNQPQPTPVNWSPPPVQTILSPTILPAILTKKIWKFCNKTARILIRLPTATRQKLNLMIMAMVILKMRRDPIIMNTHMILRMSLNRPTAARAPTMLHNTLKVPPRRYSTHPPGWIKNSATSRFGLRRGLEPRPHHLPVREALEMRRRYQEQVQFRRPALR